MDRTILLTALVAAGGLAIVQAAGRTRGESNDATGLTDADFALHVRALRADKLPEDFHLVVEPPFVVIGDEEKATVVRRARRTVGWAVRLLKEAYFDRNPDEIIDIWLFRDEKSYRKHARKLFDDEPDTPFGYYSPEHRALVMNIATGGGTLVHEIVHPFVRANFAGCPAWFNEGLGSLYEQCGERDGRIVGFTNWRLAGLQRAIRKGHTVPFAELLATSEYEFYQEDPGTHYGQARYLCYYLQQKGLLRAFYRRFHRDHKTDPTGTKTLTRLLEIEDLETFQQRWEKWVLPQSARCF